MGVSVIMSTKIKGRARKGVKGKEYVVYNQWRWRKM